MDSFWCIGRIAGIYINLKLYENIKIFVLFVALGCIQMRNNILQFKSARTKIQNAHAKQLRLLLMFLRYE